MTHGRRDRNHVDIREGLRRAGYYVVDTADLRNGFPDLLVVSKTGLVQLIEVKMPGEHLTYDEAIFHQVYPGRVCVCHSAEEAIGVMELLDKMEAA